MPVVQRPTKSQPATPLEATPFSYWSIKPWFLTEGKLASVLVIPSSWGFPTKRSTPHYTLSSSPSSAHQDFFWRRCWGEEALLQGESLTLNLFILLLFS